MATDRKVLVVVLDAARRDVTLPLLAQSKVQPLSDAAWFTCIAPSCWTVPSMASLLTGLYPVEHGLGWPLKAVPTPRPTLPQMLQQAGKTFRGMSANQMYAPPVLDLPEDMMTFPMERYSRSVTGLRRIMGLLDYGGGLIADEVVGMVRSGSTPDMLLLHIEEAHHPYLPPPTGLGSWLRYTSGHVSYYTSSKAQVWEFAARANERAWVDARRRYADCVEYDVRLLERVLSAYAEAGLLDDTLVVVTADHGEHLGEHGLADHQGSLHEELVNVPCAVMAPGLPKQGRPAGQFQHTDVVRTVLNYLGVISPLYTPHSQPLDLLDQAQWERGHEHAFMEWAAWDQGQLAKLQQRNPSYDFASIHRNLRGVRTLRWKYITTDSGERMLFDLDNDPEEKRNLASEQPAVVSELQAADDAWRNGIKNGGELQAPEPGSEYSEDEQKQLEQRLADLGYI